MVVADLGRSVLGRFLPADRSEPPANHVVGLVVPEAARQQRAGPTTPGRSRPLLVGTPGTPETEFQQLETHRKPRSVSYADGRIHSPDCPKSDATPVPITYRRPEQTRRSLVFGRPADAFSFARNAGIPISSAGTCRAAERGRQRRISSHRSATCSDCSVETGGTSSSFSTPSWRSGPSLRARRRLPEPATTDP